MFPFKSKNNNKLVDYKKNVVITPFDNSDNSHVVTVEYNETNTESNTTTSNRNSNSIKQDLEKHTNLIIQKNNDDKIFDRINFSQSNNLLVSDQNVKINKDNKMEEPIKGTILDSGQIVKLRDSIIEAQKEERERRQNKLTQIFSLIIIFLVVVGLFFLIKKAIQ